MSLNDKILYPNELSNEGYYVDRDVKEAVRELKEWDKELLKDYDKHKINFVQLVTGLQKNKDKIFGPKLVEDCTSSVNITSRGEK